MSDIDLKAIRIRDRDTYARITDENASFLRTGQVDRHDLLRYVDALREAAGKAHDYIEADSSDPDSQMILDDLRRLLGEGKP